MMKNCCQFGWTKRKTLPISSCSPQNREKLESQVPDEDSCLECTTKTQQKQPNLENGNKDLICPCVYKRPKAQEST